MVITYLKRANQGVLAMKGVRFLIAILGLFIAVLLSSTSFSALDNSAPASETSGAETKETSSLAGLVITSAQVKPEDVQPGDIMKISVNASDSFGITSVTARMPHDEGYDTVELELTEGDGKSGTWKGEWHVHDTSVRNYTTTIEATNAAGLTAQRLIEWSDSGWFSGWDYRRAITIDNTENAENLTDYQVEVDITDAIYDNSGLVGSWHMDEKNDTGDDNLIDPSTWTIGNGSVTGFNANGAESENYRISGSDPFGHSSVIWEARPDSVSGADGGWNTPSFNVNNTKMYRFSVWVQRPVQGNGHFYLGTRGYGSTDGVAKRSDGAVTTNPYFTVNTNWNEWGDTSSWYLVVGHVWSAGSGTGSNHAESGIYNTNGDLIYNADSVDYVWLPETTTSNHRTYLYYSTDTSTRQRWAYPRVDVVDGTEPSIQELAENSPNRVVIDSSGNNNIGTIVNFPGVVEGKYGNAWSFDGVNDWVQITDDVGVSGAMTIGFWFYTPNKNQNQYFFDNRNPGSWWFIKNYTGGTCGTIPGNICFEDRVMAEDGDWNINEWTYLVVTDNTSTAKMYINGNLVDTGPGEVTNISTNLRMATRYSNTAYFEGKIDEVRIYNRALSESEISELYSATKAQLNYADLRFTTDTGTATTSYWLESDKKAWVKVPSISASSQETIYMYYGNSGAADSQATIGTQSNPGLSCRTIKNHGNSSGDGVYYVDPNGGEISDAFQVYCDMSYDNGGWMLLDNFASTASGDTDIYEHAIGDSFIVDSTSMSDAGYSTYLTTYESSSYTRTSGYLQIYYGSSPIGYIQKNLPSYADEVYVKWGNWYSGSAYLKIGGSTVQSLGSDAGASTYQAAYTPGQQIRFEELGIVWPGEVWVRESSSMDISTLGASIYAEQDNLSFDYRRGITINNTGNSNNLYDYQVLVEIDTATPISEGKTNSDCSDIRFTDSTDWTNQNWDISYPYWIESGCNTSNTKIWLKVPSIPASSQETIYMYYGNSGASFGSDGDDTFRFFDDFEDGVINIDKWSKVNSTGWSINGGQLKGTNTNGRLQSLESFSSPIILESKIKAVSYPSNGYMANGFYVSSSNNFGLLCHPTYPTDYYYRTDGSWNGGYTWSGTFAEWTLSRILIKDSSNVTGHLEKYSDGTNSEDRNYTNTVSSEKITLGKRYDNDYTGQSYEGYWDHLLARKYTSSEPTTSLGSVMTSNTVAPAGAVWIEGNDLHWVDGSIEYWIPDAYIVTSSPGGSHGAFWIEGSELHWIDASGNERKRQGTLYYTTPGGPNGAMWIENGYIHYIDANGEERTLNP